MPTGRQLKDYFPILFFPERSAGVPKSAIFNRDNSKKYFFEIFKHFLFFPCFFTIFPIVWIVQGKIRMRQVWTTETRPQIWLQQLQQFIDKDNNPSIDQPSQQSTTSIDEHDQEINQSSQRAIQFNSNKQSINRPVWRSNNFSVWRDPKPAISLSINQWANQSINKPINQRIANSKQT